MDVCVQPHSASDTLAHVGVHSSLKSSCSSIQSLRRAPGFRPDLRLSPGTCAGSNFNNTLPLVVSFRTSLSYSSWSLQYRCACSNLLARRS
jgi:hypothetical protein